MADPAAFDRPELSALWTELRRRFEAAGDGEVRTVRLARLGPAERSALADLLGLVRLPGEPATVAVTRVDDAVRRGCGLGARELTERLQGRLQDRPAERAAAERAALVVLAALHDEPPLVDAAGRRDLWALYGVTGDELSTTVLVAGFTPHGSGPLATTLRIWGFAQSLCTAVSSP